MAAVYGCADGSSGQRAWPCCLKSWARIDWLGRMRWLAGQRRRCGSRRQFRLGLSWPRSGPGAAFAVLASILAVGCLALVRLQPVLGRDGAQSIGPLGQLRVGWKEFARVRWLWLLTGEWVAFSLIVLAPLAVLGPAIERELRRCGRVGADQQLPGTGCGRRAGPCGPRPGCSRDLPDGDAVGDRGRGVSRVAAIDLLGSEAGQPVGYALAGPIGQAVGAHAVLAAAAIGMLAGSVAFAFLPSLRTRIVPRAWQPDLPGAEFR